MALPIEFYKLELLDGKILKTQQPYDHPDKSLKNKWGILTVDGDTILPFLFYEVGNLREGLVRVMTKHELHDKWGFYGYKENWGHVNLKGAYIIPLDYDNASSFSKGWAKVEKKKKWGYVDTLGNIAIPIIYAAIGLPTSSGRVSITKGDQKGWFDLKADSASI